MLRCDTFHSDLPLIDLEWVFVIETDTEFNPKLS